MNTFDQAVRLAIALHGFGIGKSEIIRDSEIGHDFNVWVQWAFPRYHYDEDCWLPRSETAWSRSQGDPVLFFDELGESSLWQKS